MSHHSAQIETVRLSAQEMEELSRAALAANGFDKANIGPITDGVVACELHGSPGHGLIRVPNYIRAAASGRIDPRAQPVLEDAGPGQIVVDGRNGFAALAVEIAREEILRKARANGVVVVSLRHTHHMHALWWDIEPLAEQGLVAIECVSQRQALAVYDSKKAVLGTNPIAASFPQDSGPPITVDMASSKVSRGDIRLAAHAATPIPPDWGLDSTGAPSSDASKVLNGGAQLPFSMHPKASNIALIVEMLATVLSGDRFGFEAAKDNIKDDGPLGTGAGILALDPARLGISDYAARSREFAQYMLAMGCGRLPGSRRHDNFRQNVEAGVEAPVALVRELKTLAGGSS